MSVIEKISGVVRKTPGYLLPITDPYYWSEPYEGLGYGNFAERVRAQHKVLTGQGASGEDFENAMNKYIYQTLQAGRDPGGVAYLPAGQRKEFMGQPLPKEKED